MSILSRDPDLFRKPSNTQGKQIWGLKRTMVENNEESSPPDGDQPKSNFNMIIGIGGMFVESS